jgi:hypothetical protein
MRVPMPSVSDLTEVLSTYHATSYVLLLDFFLRPSHDIDLKSLRQMHIVKIITGPNYCSTFTAKLTAKF